MTEPRSLEEAEGLLRKVLRQRTPGDLCPFCRAMTAHYQDCIAHELYALLARPASDVPSDGPAAGDRDEGPYRTEVDSDGLLVVGPGGEQWDMSEEDGIESLVDRLNALTAPSAGAPGASTSHCQGAGRWRLKPEKAGHMRTTIQVFDDFDGQWKDSFVGADATMTALMVHELNAPGASQPASDGLREALEEFGKVHATFNNMILAHKSDAEILRYLDRAMDHAAAQAGRALTASQQQAGQR
jgi:hypothetical protein